MIQTCSDHRRVYTLTEKQYEQRRADLLISQVPYPKRIAWPAIVEQVRSLHIET